MRYTTNGTTPSTTVGTLINGSSGTASVPSGATLKAIGYKSGMSNSTIKSGLYSALPACAAPVMNPANVLNGPNPPVAYTVNISTTTSGAQMRYTINGTTPSSTQGILVNGTSKNVTIGPGTTITLKAITFKSGSSDSGVTSGYFDNQNGGDRPRPKEKGEETSQSEQKTSKVELKSNSELVSQDASQREEKEVGLARFQLNLWESDVLRKDPGLSLSWWGKKKQGGAKSGTNQTTNGSRSVVYTLDLMGNRTNVSENGVNKNYVPNVLNQYSTGHGVAVTNGASHEIASGGRKWGRV